MIVPGTTSDRSGNSFAGPRLRHAQRFLPVDMRTGRRRMHSAGLGGGQVPRDADHILVPKRFT
jgi:hypothetical protein